MEQRAGPLQKADEFLHNLGERNVSFIYAFGSTVDEKYRLEAGDIIVLVAELLELVRKNNGLSHEIVLKGDRKDDGLEERFEDSLRKFGNGKDSEVQVFSSELFSTIEKLIFNYFDKNRIVPEFRRSLGSGATYSSAAAAKFFEGDANMRAHFMGTMPSTVLQFLVQSRFILGADVINNFKEYANLHHEFNSRTIALESGEGTHKLMISMAKGRSPEELNMDALARNINRLYSNNDTGNYIVQLGSLNKGSPDFHGKIRDLFEDKSRAHGKKTIMYACTSDFKRDYKRTVDILRVVYPSGILSVNENEFDQIYNALLSSISGGHVVPKDTRVKKLAYLDDLVTAYNLQNPGKIIGINPGQIKICHSSTGAIAYTCDNSADKEIIQGLLQLSVDGTSTAYQDDVYSSYESLLDYSKGNVERQLDESFREIFGDSPSGLISRGVAAAVAPKVIRPKGTLTGLGAVFDGLASALVGLYLVSRH